MSPLIFFFYYRYRQTFRLFFHAERAGFDSSTFSIMKKNGEIVELRDATTAVGVFILLAQVYYWYDHEVHLVVKRRDSEIKMIVGDT